MLEAFSLGVAFLSGFCVSFVIMVGVGVIIVKKGGGKDIIDGLS